MSALVRRALAVALSLALTAAFAELLVRAVDPEPRMQVIRGVERGLVMAEHEGVPLWHEPSDPPLVRGSACSGPRTRDVLLAGDSVLKHTEPGALDARVRDLLQQRLQAAAGDDVCVLDASQSGYLPWQQHAAARRVHDRFGIELLVMEVWKPDRRYVQLEEHLYDAEAVIRDARGTPVGPIDLPDGLHAWLFTRSALWEYATLALARPVASPVRSDAHAYREALAWADAEGVPVMLFEAAPLHRPLAETAATRARLLAEGAEDPDGFHWAIELQREAHQQGIPYVYLPGELADRDLDAIRLDDCCHFRRAGHEAVADVLTPVIARQLGELGAEVAP